jgi:cytochrome c oxidase cbb3-type subunit 1
MQGLMWRAYDELGFLQYSFVETVEAMHPYYVIRLLGGVLYLGGALIMVFNLWKTVTAGERVQPAAVAVPARGAAVPAA